jgi:hypothetical protein
MAKHRKTRQEKMIADQRHIQYHLETSSSLEKTPVIKNLEVNKSITQPTHVTSYAYVAKDLRKTLAITAAIIIAQIFLFIVLNRI